MTIFILLYLAPVLSGRPRFIQDIGSACMLSWPLAQGLVAPFPSPRDPSLDRYSFQPYELQPSEGSFCPVYQPPLTAAPQFIPFSQPQTFLIFLLPFFKASENVKPERDLTDLSWHLIWCWCSLCNITNLWFSKAYLNITNNGLLRTLLDSSAHLRLVPGCYQFFSGGFCCWSVLSHNKISNQKNKKAICSHRAEQDFSNVSPGLLK